MYAYGGQLLAQRAYAYAGDPAPHITTYTRNALGQVSQAQAPEVTYSYGYDNAHRLSQITDGRAGKQLTYSWSPGGLLDKLNDNEGNETDYLYDATGRLIGLWAPDYHYVGFSYDAGGRLTETWHPTGLNSQYSWNADNTLAQLKNRTAYSDTAILSQHDYTYCGAMWCI